MSDTLGQRVRQLRVSRGWTHRQLAEAAGIGHPYVSKLEADMHIPSDRVLRAIATALEADPDELTILCRRVPTWAEDAIVEDPPAALDALHAFVDRPR